MPLTPQDFVSKWKRSTGREKQIYQQHFLDLCELVGHPTSAVNPQTSEVSHEGSPVVELLNETSEVSPRKRTLTNLYNARPTWLDLAHKRLDQAVLAAYGWPGNLSDEEILEKLRTLNLERSKQGLEI